MATILILLTTLLAFLGKTFAVEECYACLDKCEQSLQQHRCKDDGFSDSIEIKCYTIEVTSLDVKLTEKGCLPADVAEEECKNVNQISGTKCGVCDTDLCNGRNHLVGSGTGLFVNYVLFSTLLALLSIFWKILQI